METARLRAVGFMLPNAAPPLVLTAAACLERGARVLYWANVKTLELAFWVPGIDEMLEPGWMAAGPPRTGPGPGNREPRRASGPGRAGQVSPRRRSTPT
jgi:hypothetical protein